MTPDLTKCYVTKPNFEPRTKYHIFDEEDNQALCGRYAMWNRDPQFCSPASELKHFDKKQDCKACWRAAGLPTDEPVIPEVP